MFLFVYPVIIHLLYLYIKGKRNFLRFEKFTNVRFKFSMKVKFILIPFVIES